MKTSEEITVAYQLTEPRLNPSFKNSFFQRETKFLEVNLFKGSKIIVCFCEKALNFNWQIFLIKPTRKKFKTENKHLNFKFTEARWSKEQFFPSIPCLSGRKPILGDQIYHHAVNATLKWNDQLLYTSGIKRIWLTKHKKAIPIFFISKWSPCAKG